MRIYELLTRLIILYGAETWTLSEDIFERLRASERKILRRINGAIYTGCPRRNVQYFGRVFLMLNYADITQNTYIQS
jgi:hypothetical protein